MKNNGIKIKIMGMTFAWLLRLLRLTWQIHIKGRERLDQFHAKERHFLICFWHGKYIPIFPLLEGSDACVISSRSTRGSVISEICKNFGYQSIQIPDKPGRDSLRQMKKTILKSLGGGIAVDGPLGPRGQVKSGVIWMAGELGLSLLPVSVGSHRKTVFNKRWDRLEIPLPFSKVCLIIGQPICVPPALNSRHVKIWANRLAEAISALDNEAENMLEFITASST